MIGDPQRSLPSPDAATLLARHAARRRAKSPTVSALVGPVGPAVQAWHRWLSGQGHRSLTVEVDNPARLLPDLLGAVAATHDLTDLAHRHLHAAAGLPPPSRDSLVLRSGRDVDHLAAAATASPDPDGATRLACSLIPSRRTDEGETTAERLEALLSPGTAGCGSGGASIARPRSNAGRAAVASETRRSAGPRPATGRVPSPRVGVPHAVLNRQRHAHVAAAARKRVLALLPAGIVEVNLTP